VNYNIKFSNMLYHWLLSMASFYFCETYLLHIKLFVGNQSVNSPFLCNHPPACGWQPFIHVRVGGCAFVCLCMCTCVCVYVCVRMCVHMGHVLWAVRVQMCERVRVCVCV